jgi:hypothetical protein
MLAAGLAGCGGTPAPGPLAPVRLSVDAPPDRQTVDAESVQVHGTVSPGSAEVRVAGRQADVSGGSFRATVALAPGPNVIDVVAGAERRRSAVAAVRVVRVLDVTIPDLSGDDPGAAAKRLRKLGLSVQLHKRGGLLDDLLPGSDGVCGTDPQTGAKVAPGSRVNVTYGKVC